MRKILIGLFLLLFTISTSYSQDLHKYSTQEVLNIVLNDPLSAINFHHYSDQEVLNLALDETNSALKADVEGISIDVDGRIVVDGLVVIDPTSLAGESLDEVDFTTHAEWDDTNDMDSESGNAAYTWSANQTSTLTQLQASLVIAGVADVYYKFTYTVAVTTAFDGDGAATITTAFALAAVSLDLTAGTNTIYFRSAAVPTDFIISIVSGTDTEGTFTIDDVTLKQITGGRVDIAADLWVNGVDIGAAVGAVVPSGSNNEILTDDGAGAIVSESELLFDGTDLQLGVSTDENSPTFKIVADADSDAGGDTPETFSMLNTPNADPTLATWGFNSSQGLGFTFNKQIDITGNIIVSGTVDGVDIFTDVPLNTTHRGLTNNPHTVTLVQVGGANPALSNLASVAINQPLLLGTSDAHALGSITKMWADLFLASGAVLNWNNGDVTFTHSLNTLTLGGGNLALGSNNLGMTGSLGLTGSRVLKGWFADLESTNDITVGGTALAAIYQPLDGTLTAFAGLTIGANELIYGTGADAFSMLAVNATGTNKFLRQVSSGVPAWAILVAGDIPDISGTYQPLDGALTNISGLVYVSPSFIKLTANDTYAVRTLSEVRTDLGLVIGTNVQAYDADLTTWAGVTPSANGQSLVASANYASMRGLLDLEAGTDFYSKSAEDTWRNSVTQTEMGYLHGISLFGESLIDDADAPAGRATLGGTTIGQAIFIKTNPGAITFGRANADNSFDWLSDANFRTAIGVDVAGTDNSTDVTLHATATAGGMSLAAQEISNRAATNAQTGYMTAALVGNIETNNAKNTNVPTELTLTRTATTNPIESDGGAADITLVEADTDNAGLLGADKWDEIVANSLKDTNTDDQTIDVFSGAGNTISISLEDDGEANKTLDISGFTAIAANTAKVVGTHPVATIYVPSSDQARADDSAITIANTIVRVVGDGAAVLLDTAPSISDGAADGQMVVIQGTSDANTVTIADNTNCQLAGGVNMTLGKGDTIHLIWDSGDSDWYELNRSDN